MARGDRARDRGHWAQAAEAYATALQIDPSHAAIRVQYGHVLKEQGAWHLAEQAYRDAAAGPRGNGDALHHLAALLRARGGPANAAATGQAPAPALAFDTFRVERDQGNEAAGEGPAGPAPFRDLDDLPPLRPRSDTAGTVPPPSPADRLRAAATRIGRAAGGRRPARAIAFIHLQKTGGSTLRDWLQGCVPLHRVCPADDDALDLFGAADLAGFDLFSGHFDWASLRLIPRPVATVSVFRDPQARLISVYRSHRAHRPKGVHAANLFMRLANELSPEEFFEHPDVRRAPEVFNHYLVAFGLTYRQVARAATVDAGRVPQVVVDRAVSRVRGLDMIGLTDRLDDTARFTAQAFGLRPPPSLPRSNATDSVGARHKGEAPPRVAVTPRLKAALEELIGFDRVIYAAAREEFEQRAGAAARR